MYDEMSGEVEENLKPFTSMGRLGFEPRTNRLKAECSTAELATLALCVKHSYLL